MAVFPVVKGVRLRATRVDSCGMPIAGPDSRVVTSGFITLKLSPQMRDAKDIEQTNAEGRVCVSDRTPPERKWWNVTLELCNVDTCLFNMFTDWITIVGYDGKPVGFADKKTVPATRGVAIEVWTGVGIDDSCDVPTSDAVLTSTSTTPYGYFVIPVMKEVTLGDIEIGEKASTFMLTGITAPGTRWGKGPYNVVATDNSNTAGRLIDAWTKDPHVAVLKTTIAPPAAETGCCPLVLPTPYYGATAVAVAPAQPACDKVCTNEKQQIAITGAPTGGTFTLTFNDGTTSQTTAAIAYNATAAQIDTALEALSNVGTGRITATGGPLPGTAVVVEFVSTLAERNFAAMTATSSLTGGTTPTVVITTTQEGANCA